jgi:hypothetical protein
MPRLCSIGVSVNFMVKDGGPHFENAIHQHNNFWFLRSAPRQEPFRDIKHCYIATEIGQFRFSG